MEPNSVNKKLIRNKYDFSNNILIKDIHKKLSILPSLIDINDSINDYKYYIDNILEKTSKIFTKKRINICVYKINKSNTDVPFILYLLNKIDSTMFFPNFFSDKEVVTECFEKLKILFENYKQKPNYKGILETENNIYVFFNINMNFELVNLNKNDKWWWTTIFEIVNLKQILNFKIDRLVYNIFFKNNLLCSLFKDNKKIPSGMVTFLGGNSGFLNFIAGVGIPKAPPDSNLGPYYYSYTYYGAGRGAIFADKGCNICKEFTRENSNIYKEGGIVRFIVFANSGLWFLNRDIDTMDNSLTSRLLYNQNSNFGNFIKLIGKLRDVNGNWAIYNDLAYVSSSLIKTSKINKEWNDRKLIIQFATKYFLQNTPLTYHFVDIENFIKENKDINEKNLPYEYKNYKIK